MDMSDLTFQKKIWKLTNQEVTKNEIRIKKI